MSRRAWRGAWPLVLAAAACAAAPGCVDRRFVITSDPPHALVEVNGRPAGFTPADRQFTYYGTYRLVVRHEGYETLVVDQPVPPPWYEYPGLDFISENVIPWTIRDVRRIHLPLHPIQIVPPEAVLDRAQQLRAQGQTVGKPVRVPAPTGRAVPVPAVPVVPDPLGPQQVPPAAQTDVPTPPASIMPPARP